MALARLCASRSVVVDVLYKAAAVARLFDDLDITELAQRGPDAETRRQAWADLLRLVEPHAQAGEPFPTTVRRMLGENLAVRALYTLLLQEPNR